MSLMSIHLALSPPVLASNEEIRGLEVILYQT